MQNKVNTTIIHLGPKKNSGRPWGGVIFAVSHTWKVTNLAGTLSVRLRPVSLACFKIKCYYINRINCYKIRMIESVQRSSHDSVNLQGQQVLQRGSG
jgi:hypothetical protein